MARAWFLTTLSQEVSNDIEVRMYFHSLVATVKWNSLIFTLIEQSLTFELWVHTQQ